MNRKLNQEGVAKKEVTVAVQAFPGNLEMLGIAADYAAKMKVELNALFIEDASLLRLAELPFSTELNRFSGEIQELNRSRLISSMRAQVKSLEKLLDSYREKKKVQTQLRIVRGNYLTEIIHAQSNILFASSGHGVRDVLSGNQAGLLVENTSTQRFLPIWACISENSESQHVMRLALELATMLKTGLVIGFPRQIRSDMGGIDEQLRERKGVPVRYQVLDFEFPDSTIENINSQCSYLVVSKSTALTDLVQKKIHERIRSPMIWVA